jgi:hypothetical protein
MLSSCIDAIPEFASVIGACNGSPTRVGAIVVGLGVIARFESIPLHDSGTVTVGVDGSLLETTKVPFSPPVDVGLHVTAYAFDAPAASV